MMITDKLVMLNFPKTGSTFAREVIKKLYAARESKLRKCLVRLSLCRPGVRDLKMPQIDAEINYGIKAQHGTLRQIPAAHRNKPIISITRDPFRRYVSLYLFRWWEQHPPAERGVILARYPHFPKLSFAEYYEMMHEYGRKNRLRGIVPKIELGFQSIQFVQFYFPDPEAVLRKIDDDYIDRRLYRNDMGPVHFLHQENLNPELKEFLLRIGFGEEELRFVDAMGKINVTENRQGGEDYEKFYSGTPIRQQILERERLLFAIFPEYLPAPSASPPGAEPARNHG